MMAKTLFQVFEENFVKEIRQARNYPEAYERASERFEEQHGFTAFNSYETFRKKKKKGK